MSAIEELISKRSEENPESKNFFRQEQEKLDIAVALMKLRKKEGLSQRELAEKAGKPQSTIARIESGTMNASFKVIGEIAHALGKKVEVRFV